MRIRFDKFTRRCGILAALAGSLALSAAALDLGRADGALTINGKSTPLQYAYAFFDSGENGQRIVDVLLTDNAVPNPGPKPDPRKLRSQGLTVVEVRMTPSGQPVRMVFEKGDMPINAYQFGVTGFAMRGGTVEGTIAFDKDFFGDKLAVHSHFKTALGAANAAPNTASKQPDIVDATTMFTPSPRAQQSNASRALPAGGGDPGKAWLTYDAALRKGDTVAAAQMMTAGAADRFRKDQVASVRMAFRPRNVEIVSGTVAGNTATLEVRGTSLRRGTAAPIPRSGTVTLQRESGGWKVDSEEWRTAQPQE